LKLPDGTERVGGSLTTRRRRHVGEIVNLPDGPVVRSAKRRGDTTKGHLWRLDAIEAREDSLIEATLVLTYERPHSETVTESQT
jgi:hypothetical protein